MLPSLALGTHLTVAAPVANFMFLTTELPMTSVHFAAGVSLSGENLLETGTGGWLVHVLQFTMLPSSSHAALS